MIKDDGKKSTGMRLLAGSLWPSFVLLRKNDPLRLAGATAFFTTFALPPIVFILAQLFGLLMSPKTVGSGLIGNLADNLGADGAQQVRQVVRSILGFSNNWYVIILGFIFLLFVATTLFIVIKNSLNQIWEVPPETHLGWIFGMIARLKSMAIILLVGILFFADLLFNSLQAIAGGYVESLIGSGSIYFQLIFSQVTSVIIVSAWFVMLFRFLTDGRPRWKAALIGGLLTGILFTAGRYLLRLLLIRGNVGLMYGTSGSLVLVLLFVFYTSLIMYYGACFIAVYSQKQGWPLKGRRKAADIQPAIA